MARGRIGNVPSVPALRYGPFGPTQDVRNFLIVLRSNRYQIKVVGAVPIVTIVPRVPTVSGSQRSTAEESSDGSTVKFLIGG